MARSKFEMFARLDKVVAHMHSVRERQNLAGVTALRVSGIIGDVAFQIFGVRDGARREYDHG